ncbi:WYL domain-containing protein [Nonomuraea africana]|uniref:WYL domain-containing protein n=1 Tax=Nonomuraea africana TaxID=46171 RepID=UPI00178BCA79|nr:WYL domain-containing protein [Nonomuraea africana]
MAAVNHRWYLVAFDEHRSDWRIFRVDRMGAPHRTGVRVGARELPGGVDAATCAVSSIKAMG